MANKEDPQDIFGMSAEDAKAAFGLCEQFGLAANNYQTGQAILAAAFFLNYTLRQNFPPELQSEMFRVIGIAIGIGVRKPERDGGTETCKHCGALYSEHTCP